MQLAHFQLHNTRNGKYSPISSYDFLKWHLFSFFLSFLTILNDSFHFSMIRSGWSASAALFIHGRNPRAHNKLLSHFIIFYDWNKKNKASVRAVLSCLVVLNVLFWYPQPSDFGPYKNLLGPCFFEGVFFIFFNIVSDCMGLPHMMPIAWRC
jgi:hypothetical protein